jgi:hypothetical protein
MDEPHVSGMGDGNTWGPPGTLDKSIVDSLCGYAKAIFPTLRVGVAHVHTVLDPTVGYKVCDFQMSQFSYRFGTPAQWRDQALDYTRRTGTPIVFSFNPVNGGTPDRDGVWDCKDQGGIKGSRQPNCAMTARQILDAATTLGKATCIAQTFWRYDGVLNATYRSAYQTAAEILSNQPLACDPRRK